MAKKPAETREVYRIHGETSKEEFGEYLAVLTRMGMKNIGYELITEVSQYKQKQKHETGTVDFAKEWIAEHPTFDVRDLVAHFDQNGRHSGSAYAAARQLMEARFLSKSGPGKYYLTGMKALPAPAKSSAKPAAKPEATAKPNKPKYLRKGEKPPKYAKGHAPRLAIGNYDFLWGLIKNRDKFKTASLNDRFVSVNRNMKSVSPVLTKMSQKGIVKNLGGGEWQVIGKPPGDRRKSPLNSGKPAEASAATPEEATNGS